MIPQLNKSIQNAVQNSNMEIQEILATRMSRIDEYLLSVKPTTASSLEPTNGTAETWAKAMFALATTASFIRLLVLTLSSQFIGPLQISLGGMFYDILKFVVVFVVVWAAFGIGLNTIFYIYEEADQKMCRQSNELDCRDGPFLR